MAAINLEGSLKFNLKQVQLELNKLSQQAVGINLAPDYGALDAAPEEIAAALEKALQQATIKTQETNLFGSLFSGAGKAVSLAARAVTAPFRDIFTGVFEKVGLELARPFSRGFSDALNTTLSKSLNINGLESVGGKILAAIAPNAKSFFEQSGIGEAAKNISNLLIDPTTLQRATQEALKIISNSQEAVVFEATQAAKERLAQERNREKAKVELAKQTQEQIVGRLKVELESVQIAAKIAALEGREKSQQRELQKAREEKNGAIRAAQIEEEIVATYEEIERLQKKQNEIKKQQQPGFTPATIKLEQIGVKIPNLDKALANLKEQDAQLAELEAKIPDSQGLQEQIARFEAAKVDPQIVDGLKKRLAEEQASIKAQQAKIDQIRDKINRQKEAVFIQAQAAVSGGILKEDPQEILDKISLEADKAAQELSSEVFQAGGSQAQELASTIKKGQEVLASYARQTQLPETEGELKKVIADYEKNVQELARATESAAGIPDPKAAARLLSLDIKLGPIREVLAEIAKLADELNRVAADTENMFDAIEQAAKNFKAFNPAQGKKMGTGDLQAFSEKASSAAEQLESIPDSLQEAFRIVAGEVERLSGIQFKQFPQLKTEVMRSVAKASKNTVTINANLLADDAAEASEVLIGVLAHELRHIVQQQVAANAKNLKDKLSAIQSAGLDLGLAELKDLPEEIQDKIRRQILASVEATVRSVPNIKPELVPQVKKYSAAIEADAYLFVERNLEAIVEGVRKAAAATGKADPKLRKEAERAMGDIVSFIAEESGETARERIAKSGEEVSNIIREDIASELLEEIAEGIQGLFTVLKNLYREFTDEVTASAIRRAQEVFSQIQLEQPGIIAGAAQGAAAAEQIPELEKFQKDLNKKIEGVRQEAGRALGDEEKQKALEAEIKKLEAIKKRNQELLIQQEKLAAEGKKLREVSEEIIRQQGKLKIAVDEKDVAGIATAAGNLERLIGLERGTADIGKAVKATGDAFGNLRDFVKAAVGAGLGVLVLQFIDFQEVVQAANAAIQKFLSIEELSSTIINTSESAQKAVETLSRLGAQADSLKVPFELAARGLSQLQGATANTNLAEVGATTSEAILTAARAYGLSAEGLDRANVAIAQGFSKGVVQSEELRGQLAEALPNAIQVAARAYGTTTQEITRLVEQGELASTFYEKFSQQLKDESIIAAAKNTRLLSASFTDLSNQQTKLQVSLVQSFSPIIKFFTDLGAIITKIASENVPAIVAAFKALGVVILAAFAPSIKLAIGAIGTALKFLAGTALSTREVFLSMTAAIAKVAIVTELLVAATQIFIAFSQAGESAAESIKLIDQASKDFINDDAFIDALSEANKNLENFRQEQPLYVKAIDGIGKAFKAIDAVAIDPILKKLGLLRENAEEVTPIQLLEQKEALAQADLIDKGNQELAKTIQLLSNIKQGQSVDAEQLSARRSALTRLNEALKSENFLREDSIVLSTEQRQAIAKLLPILIEEIDLANGITTSYGKINAARQDAIDAAQKAEAELTASVAAESAKDLQNKEATEQQKLQATLDRIQAEKQAQEDALIELEQLRNQIETEGGDTEKLDQDIRKTETEITKLIKEEAESRISIREKEYQEAAALLDKQIEASRRTADLIVKQQKTSAQRLANEGKLSADDLAAYERDLDVFNHEQKLSLIEKEFEQTKRARVSEEEREQRLDRLKIEYADAELEREKAISAQLQNSQQEQQKQLEKIAQLEEKRRENIKNTLNLEKSRLDFIKSQLDAINQIEEERGKLIKARSDFLAGSADLEIARLERAKSILADLDNPDLKFEERANLTRELSALGIKGAVSQEGILKRIIQIEEERSRIRVEVARIEEEKARKRLEIEEDLARIANRQRVLASRQDLLEREDDALKLAAELKKAIDEKDSAGIALLRERLKILEQQKRLSQEILDDAQSQEANQAGINQQKQNTLRLEQQLNRAQLLQEEQFQGLDRQRERVGLPDSASFQIRPLPALQGTAAIAPLVSPLGEIGRTSQLILGQLERIERSLGVRPPVAINQEFTGITDRDFARRATNGLIDGLVSTFAGF